jgi:hypothetical protein
VAFPTDVEKIHPDLENYNREILERRQLYVDTVDD